MYRFGEFRRDGRAFWLKVRFVSETIGYTNRSKGNSSVRSYTVDEIGEAFRLGGYQVDADEAERLSQYSRLRAEAANIAKDNLMNADEAKAFYQESLEAAQELGFSWDSIGIDIPMNKQKGSKRDVAFLTALVDMQAFLAVQETGHVADFDPRALLKFSDSKGRLIGSNSRRLDGAVDSVNNPIAVWEIKEYYYTTTFGSRIADGVYESRLDGYEFEEIANLSGRRPFHALFIDSYSVWWEQGKSYLCRLIDMLNEGSVDAIYFGREVALWKDDLKKILEVE